MLAALPLLALPITLYNVLAVLAGGFHGVGVGARLSEPLLAIPMASHAQWAVSLGDLFLAGALVVLFMELLKSTAGPRMAIVNHSLSTILFMLCLVEFLLFPAFATSVFFLMMLMVLLDVLAGFIMTIAASRRAVEVRER